jgi:hypothetical protein
MKIKFALMLLLPTLLILSPNFAESAEIDWYSSEKFESLEQSPWTQETTYIEKSIHKLGFGLFNSSVGWTALLFEPANHSNFFTGLGKGLWRSVTNTAGGLLHTATFLFPFDIPLPEGGMHYDRAPDYNTSPEIETPAAEVTEGV